MSGKQPPPFTALRAIEAAVRHRNYTWAAKELAVTHSAISQSIKRLEADLGTKLFERRGSAMEPSAAALQLAQAYAGAAEALQRSLEDIAQAPAPNRLIIAMPPDFGRLWFAPRLIRLSASLSDIVVELRTQGGSDELDDCDLVLQSGRPTMPGWSCEILTDVILTPLCSRAFAERFRLAKPADVLRVPLLAQRHRPWEPWLDSAGLAAATARRSHLFDDVAMLLDAAERGDGLALGQRLLAEPRLRSGMLVAPIAHAPQLGEQIFVARRKQADNAAMLDMVVHWMKGELRP